jgi:hypothetical protein
VSATSNEKITVDALMSVIIEALAVRQDKTPAGLRAELLTEGRGLPVDSVLIAEILTDIEARYKIHILADAQAARSTGSVQAFAQTVHRVITEGS